MPTATESLDVLIVGAGLSVVGAACQLKPGLPCKPSRSSRTRDDGRHLGPLRSRHPSDSDMSPSATLSLRGRSPHSIAERPAITAVHHGDAATLRHENSATATRCGAPVGRADAMDPSRPCALICAWRHRRAVVVTCNYFDDVLRLLPDYDEATRRRSRAWTASTADHPSQHWPKTSTTLGKRVSVTGTRDRSPLSFPSRWRNCGSRDDLQRTPTYVCVVPGRPASPSC